MFFFYSLLLFAVAVGPTSAWASPPLEEQPGYIDFSSLDLFDGPEPETTVEIYLKNSLLDLVAAATRSEDPELADMLEALYLIRFQAYHKEEGQDLDTSYDYERIAERLKSLTLPDWERVVQVRKRDQRVQFYVRTEDETIVGLLVLAGDPHEFVFINIVGSLDLAQVGRIGRKFDMAPLDSIDFGAATTTWGWTAQESLIAPLDSIDFDFGAFSEAEKDSLEGSLIAPLDSIDFGGGYP